ncbi:hypothetical protein CSM38_003501 [Salmonella enterica subsp. arizonae]|uniref:Uncharacterized protein n=1 Tax=Salmonella enterica subsp. arizonae serovar 48:z4,z24:- TaxID=1967584 RepID=A0A738XF51_SALER|nr:hypothetical protein [Salmonella enterica]EDQ7102264.1 hypothetical protein [Salmonella enterica subsp. houtenae serovar 48:g,z51:-]EDR1779455.1 hypothetical protein [Salmonella enterica subsp. arizonae]EDW8071853.1 hypothetical protein [Salmonella enterica subsp. arizonae serovar 48:z4,z24:-]HAF0498350.1 hypothetical protein [Salmonella enterica subsp. arizonae serovar 62:z36:-]
MNHGLIWCKKRAEVAFGGHNSSLFTLQKSSFGRFLQQLIQKVRKSVDGRHSKP